MREEHQQDIRWYYEIDRDAKNLKFTYKDNLDPGSKVLVYTDEMAQSIKDTYDCELIQSYYEVRIFEINKRLAVTDNSL